MPLNGAPARGVGVTLSCAPIKRSNVKEPLHLGSFTESEMLTRFVAALTAVRPASTAISVFVSLLWSGSSRPTAPSLLTPWSCSWPLLPLIWVLSPISRSGFR
jgi:hypothetical protein